MLNNLIKRIISKYHNPYKEIENIKYLVSQKKFGDAYTAVNVFIDNNGPLVEALFLKAKIARRLGKLDESLSLFKSLEEVSEYKLESYWGQSMIYTKTKKIKDAQNKYAQIEKLSNNMPLIKQSKEYLQKEVKGKLAEDINNKNLLLTTFPKHASNNVGDQLISYSATKLIKSKISDFDPIVEFRATNLDKYIGTTVENIFAPGFSICDETYPKLFGLFSDNKNLPNFYPIGCSFQHTEPSFEAFDSYTYSTETLDFFKSITLKSGPLPCRDQLIVDMLNKHDVPAVYSGDMAIYDERYLNTTFVPPKEISSIVFTIGHHERYKEQSFEVLKMIVDFFPESKLYVAFHSKESPKSRVVADRAISLGYKELHLYGDVANLNIYDDIDLHVGYRLHGHISFLRRRKPSILLIEDARSFGFAKTEGTSLGCFDAYDTKSQNVIKNVPNQILIFLENQIKNNFIDYTKIFNFIDATYDNFVNRYFEDVSSKIRLYSLEKNIKKSKKFNNIKEYIDIYKCVNNETSGFFTTFMYANNNPIVFNAPFIMSLVESLQTEQINSIYYPLLNDFYQNDDILNLIVESTNQSSVIEKERRKIIIENISRYSLDCTSFDALILAYAIMVNTGNYDIAYAFRKLAVKVIYNEYKLGDHSYKTLMTVLNVSFEYGDDDYYFEVLKLLIEKHNIEESKLEKINL